MKITKIAIVNQKLFDNTVIKNFNLYYKNNEFFQIKIIPFEKINKLKFKRYNIVIFDLARKDNTHYLANLLQNANKYTCPIIISNENNIKDFSNKLNIDYIDVNKDNYVINGSLTQYGIDYVKKILCLNYLKGIYHYEYKINW